MYFMKALVLVGNMTVLTVLTECNFYIFCVSLTIPNIMATFHDNDSLRFAHKTLLCR